MNRLSSTPLAFGKIPAHGDFVRVGPRTGVVEILDQWLQEGVIELKRQAPEPSGVASPVRFVFSSPQAEDALVGSMVMSADRVGRRYPFLAARMIDASTLASSRSWWWPVLWREFLNEAASLALAGASGTPVDEIVRQVEWLPALADLGPEPAHHNGYADVTGAAFWRSIWGSADASQKYAVMLRLLQLRDAGGTSALSDGGLSFPLPSHESPVPGEVFWLRVLDRLIPANDGAPSIAWPAGSDGARLLVFPNGPSRRGAAALCGAEVSQRTVFDLSSPMARPIEAVLALPARYGALLEQDDLTLTDILNEL